MGPEPRGKECGRGQETGQPVPPSECTQRHATPGTHVGHDELLEVLPGAGGELLPKAEVDLVLGHGLPAAQVPTQLCNHKHLQR